MEKRKQFKHRITALPVATVGLALLFVFHTPQNANAQTESATQNHQKQKSKIMKKILIIGINPQTIDFSNPEIAPGLTAEKVELGTKATIDNLVTMGYAAESFFLDTGASDYSQLIKKISSVQYDGIVIGNGIRGLASNFIMFEQIVNVVHEHAPKSKILFNSLPTNTDEAVKRWF